MITGNTETLYYGYYDHLGSLIALTDKDGTVVEQYAYDPWGNRRNPTNWAQADSRISWLVNRGFTMHEHLDAFGIINMNGRVYDPLTALFFSPDPHIQAPDNWLNYNRYLYAYGNPLLYTDPDGEFVHLIIGAIVGGFLNYMFNDMAGNVSNFGDALKYFGVGAVAGALGAGVGSGISSAWAGGSFGAGFMGSSRALTATTSFFSGAAIGGGAGFASGFTTGLVNGLLGGQNFGEALWSGTKSGIIGGLSGAVLGGLTSGYDAYKNDRNFWTGKLPTDNTEIWGTITLNSSIVPEGELSSNIDAGHAWLELTDLDGNTTSWGTWGYLDATDPTLTALRENYQYDLGRSAEMSKSIQITHAQKARFDAFISKPSSNQWTMFKNCSYFATKAFNYTTGLNMSAHPFLTPLSTPAWLVRIYK